MKTILFAVALFTFGFISAQDKSPKILHVKFKDGTKVSAQSGSLFLANEIYPNTSGLSQFGHWEPFYSISSDLLQSYYAKAKERLKKNLSDPNTIFEFHVNAGENVELVKKKLETLTALKYVSVPPKLSTPAAPNLQPSQLYLFDQDPGIHVQEFWNTYANHGSNVKICDVEYMFNADHEDLPNVTIIGPEPEDPGFGPNHGTAVLGEIGSLNDGIGTTGITYESDFYFAGAYINFEYYLEEALISTLTELGEGDIVLIEQQTMAFDGTPDEGYAPVEWYEPFYDAIQLISGNGIIVVEAAGNGNRNLDHAMFSTDNFGHHPFLQENWSEAIMVGAGAVGVDDLPRAKLWFSNYGSRIDVQGNGEEVVTTGYGTAYSAEGLNREYSNSFGGTSGASPIVTGAVALLQSLHKQHAGFPFDVNYVRNLLITTGKPQVEGTLFPLSEKIGPLPNVFAAANLMMDELGIETFEKDAFTVYPNPTQSSFTIYVPSESVSSIQLRDVSGKEIQLNKVKTITGFEVTNSTISEGMYYLSIYYKDGTVVTKPVQIVH
ncbi:S8 family peptidase [Fluviicola taffensis]|uniref:Peptidase S8 and S53 subtilisin kexin sedolisin n=1 Tax=Fluviicola taffensis (strain DSM 16823 / NCIMB 13979 / RW262) TaxID=755732 RepID=F2IF66_FLUTR|nr:S8 family peptidase [Fluviicola taffensis]AEA43540.1 peptidase S8 and S53 subtilisin kexin sedolisin [Fluviicola taffensis DSM 16823]